MPPRCLLPVGLACARAPVARREEGAQPSSPARPESGAEPFGQGYQIVRLVRPDRVPGGRKPPDAAPVVRDRQRELSQISDESRPALLAQYRAAVRLDLLDGAGDLAKQRLTSD